MIAFIKLHKIVINLHNVSDYFRAIFSYYLRNDLTSSGPRRLVGCHRSHEQKPKELLEKRVTVRSILRVPFTRKDRDESDNSLRGGCTALEVKKWSQRCAESREELFRGYR
nr:hypothetical protein Iba_chr02aCG0440 [Ipomoea batatas]